MELGSSVESIVAEYLEKKYGENVVNLFPDQPLSDTKQDEEWDDSWVYSDNDNYNKSLEHAYAQTLQAIKEGKKILYQPSFLWSNCFVRADFMVLNDEGKYDLIEVKAKTGIRKDVMDNDESRKIGEVDNNFIEDLSFQNYVISQVFTEKWLAPLAKKYIYYLNKEYIKDGPLDIMKLVTEDEVGTLTSISVSQWKKDDKKTVTKRRKDTFLDDKTIELTIKNIDEQMKLSVADFEKIWPFPWNKYLDYFGESKPWGTVMSIPGLHASKASIVAEMYYDGTIDLSELDDDQIESFYSKSGPWSAGTFINYYLECKKTGNAIIDKNLIKKEFDWLVYPLCFYDYESVSVPIPFMDKTYAYQQVVVQYSLHKYYEDGSMKHYGGILGWLAENKTVETIVIPANPNAVWYESEKIVSGSYRDLLDEFLVDIGDDINQSSFVVRSKGFENARNKEISEIFPDIADSYLAINDKTFDLRDVFSKNMYFDLGCFWSSSIKKVLPVLVPQMSYDSLEIGNWSLAMKALSDVLSSKLIWPAKSKTLENLLLYCWQDSLAMVRIFEAINSKLKSN